MSDAALFTIAGTWKLPSCPSAGEHIYTMGHRWAAKKSEILPFATAWMGLEGDKLSEISQP